MKTGYQKKINKLQTSREKKYRKIRNEMGDDFQEEGRGEEA